MGNMSSKNTITEVTDGAAHVRPLPGPVTQSRNRSRTALAEIYAEATNTVTWNTSDNITELTVYVTATDSQDTAAAGGVGLAAENYALIALNAGNEAIAAAWLSILDSQASDVQYIKIPIGIPTKIYSFSAITRMDAVPVDVSGTLTAITMWVGAN